METKYDRYQKNKAVKFIRMGNIKTLTTELTEAETVLMTLRNRGRNDLETKREEQTVIDEINRIRELLEDEQRAVQSLEQATDDEANEVIKKMEF